MHVAMPHLLSLVILQFKFFVIKLLFLYQMYSINALLCRTFVSISDFPPGTLETIKTSSRVDSFVDGKNVLTSKDFLNNGYSILC